MNTSQDPVYILLHIPKCAGFSMSSHMLTFFHADKYCGLYTSMGPLLENRSMIEAYLTHLPGKKLNSLRVIAGHGAYYGIHTYLQRPVRYVVFLRHPFHRSRSHYAHMAQNTHAGLPADIPVLDKGGVQIPFAEWMRLRSITHDFMTRFLYEKFFPSAIRGEVTDQHLTNVLGVLNTFYFVGLTEHQTHHRFLYDCLGLPVYAPRENVTDTRFVPPAVPDSSISRYLLQDSRLYNYARAMPRPALSRVKRADLLMKYIRDRARFSIRGNRI